MEMSVCTESVGNKIGEVLTNFFRKLDEPEEEEIVPPPQPKPTTPSWKKKLPIKEEEEAATTPIKSANNTLPEPSPRSVLNVPASPSPPTLLESDEENEAAAAEEQERLAKEEEEKERLAAEEAKRLERERIEKERLEEEVRVEIQLEQARIEKERLAAEEEAAQKQAEINRLAKEEERLAAEELARKEAEELEKARLLEAEKLAAKEEEVIVVEKHDIVDNNKSGDDEKSTDSKDEVQTAPSSCPSASELSNLGDDEEVVESETTPEPEEEVIEDSNKEEVVVKEESNPFEPPVEDKPSPSYTAGHALISEVEKLQAELDAPIPTPTKRTKPSYTSPTNYNRPQANDMATLSKKDQLNVVGGRSLKAVEGNMPTLQQRLSSYGDASSSSKKKEEPNLSLDQRKASYVKNTSTAKADEDASAKSLKDRMSTFQKPKGFYSATDARTPKKNLQSSLHSRMAAFGEAAPNQKLNEIKSNFQEDEVEQPTKAKATPEVAKKEDGSVVLSVGGKSIQARSLKDRMSAFSHKPADGAQPIMPISPVAFTKSQPKKTSHQLRMEKFQQASSSTSSADDNIDTDKSEKSIPKWKQQKSTYAPPPNQQVKSLKERMAAYASTAAPTAKVDEFAVGKAAKKQPIEEETKKVPTFKARAKVNSGLQQRMSAFQKKEEETKEDVEEEEESVPKEEPVTPLPEETNKPEVAEKQEDATVPASLNELQDLVTSFTASPEFQKKDLVDEPVSASLEAASVDEKAVEETPEMEEKTQQPDDIVEEAKAKLDDEVVDEKPLEIESTEPVVENEAVVEDKPLEIESTDRVVENEAVAVVEDEAKASGVPVDEEVKPEDKPYGLNEKMAELQEQAPVSKGTEDVSVGASTYTQATGVGGELNPPEVPSDYLYDLFVRFEKLRSQNAIINKHLNKINEEPGQDEKDISSKLSGIVGSRNSYTASNRDWLNKEWIEKHVDGNGCFKFRDPLLFKTFTKTNEKARDKIIRTFVKQLRKHANGITQLDLASCLLPDKFLEDLVEAITRRPAESFPNLQLINVESNLLKGSGIEALAKVIANKSALKYLQVILLENQKDSISSAAERAMADSVKQSQSIVICSMSIRCQFASKDMNDALLYNNDQLRLARRAHQSENGTLKERKRTEMELYFDSIAANEAEVVVEVSIVGDNKFKTLEEVEKIKTASAFANNTSVKTVKMELIGLNDDWAVAFGESIAQNETITKVNIDSNNITGRGMLALFEGLGDNNSIEEFQVRHQKKPMASTDEEELYDLLASNTSLIKLGVDVRNQLVKTKLERIVADNREQLRKLRNAQKKKEGGKDKKKSLLKGLSKRVRI